MFWVPTERQTHASSASPYKETHRTVVFAFTGGDKKQHRASSWESKRFIQKSPLSMTRNWPWLRQNGKVFFSHFGASLLILYTIHPYTCDTNSRNLPQSIEAQHTYCSVDTCIFNHHPAYMDQKWFNTGICSSVKTQMPDNRTHTGEGRAKTFTFREHGSNLQVKNPLIVSLEELAAWRGGL